VSAPAGGCSCIQILIALVDEGTPHTPRPTHPIPTPPGQFDGAPYGAGTGNVQVDQTFGDVFSTMEYQDAPT